MLRSIRTRSRNIRTRIAAAVQRPIVAALVQTALVIVALGAGWWVIGQAWPELVALERPPDARWLAASAGTYTLALALAIAGWRWLLRCVGVRRPWLEDAWFYTLSLAARRLPGGIWGAVGRVYLYRQAGAPTGPVTVATVAEHGLIIVAAAALAPVALAVLPLRTNGAAWLGLAAIGTLTVALTRPHVWTAAARALVRRRLLPREMLVQQGGAAWLGVGGIYALVWLVGGTALWLVARSLGAEDADLGLVVAAWIIARGAALPLALLPAGLGLSDLGLTLLLGYALPPPLALASAVLMRGLVTLGEAGWALVLLTISQAIHMMNPATRRAFADDGPETQRGEEWA